MSDVDSTSRGGVDSPVDTPVDTPVDDVGTTSRAGAEPSTRPSLMTARQKQVLLLLLGAQFMLAADFTILTVALPTIGNELGFGLGNLQWITTGYALPAAGLTLLCGRATDLFGRRRMFVGGLVLLIVASVVGGLAATPAVLIGARVGQGVATAMAVPSSLSLLTTSFPEGPLRQRALGLNGSLLGGGFTAGALVGGLLTGLVSWRWSFLINVPIAAAILIGTLLIVRDERPVTRTKLDVPGALTVTGGLVALAFGITTAGKTGWTDPTTLVSFGLAVVLLGAFGLIESRSSNPLASLEILKSRTVALGNFGGMVAIAMGTGVSFLMTLYLQEVLGFNSLLAGVALGLPGLTTVLGGFFAAGRIGRIGAPAALALSLVGQAVPIALLVLLGPGGLGVWLVVAMLAVVFLGHVFSIVSYMITATSGLPDHEQGLATGLTTMSMQIGITLGIPVLSAVVTSRTTALRPSVGSDRLAILGGLHAGVITNALIMTGTAVLVWLVLRTVNRNTVTTGS